MNWNSLAFWRPDRGEEPVSDEEGPCPICGALVWDADTTCYPPFLEAETSKNDDQEYAEDVGF